MLSDKFELLKTNLLLRHYYSEKKADIGFIKLLLISPFE